jgi:MFS family permease
VPFGLLHGFGRSLPCLSSVLEANEHQDNTIIATAIPRITDQFKALNDVGWYGSSYLLTTCATQLIYGKFYTFYSIKWVYLTALAIFELGSLICGVAPNSTALIIGRAIAGVGAAGIFSGAIWV